MADLTFDQALEKIFPTLPVPIQKFLGNRKVDQVAAAIRDKYALRVDEAGLVQRELLLILLGAESPDTAFENLQNELPVSDGVLEDIFKDFNAMVFTPIQNEMRAGAQKPAPVPQQPQPRQQQPVISAPRYASFTPPQPPRAAAPAPANLPGAPRPERMLEDHEEPHIEVRQAAPQPRPQPVPVQPPAPRPPQPQQFQQPRPQVAPPPMPPRPPFQAPQPQSQSFMRPNPPTPRPAPVATQTVTPIPRAPEVSRPILKEYGVDPYREPPE